MSGRCRIPHRHALDSVTVPHDLETSTANNHQGLASELSQDKRGPKRNMRGEEASSRPDSA